MKCWAVKKILPLFIGEDLSFFHRSIKRHVEKCSACNQYYRQYDGCRQKLGLLKTPNLDQKIFKNYWEGIHSRIAEEKKVPELSWLEESLLNLWKPAIAVASILILATFFIFRETNFDPKPSSKYPTHTYLEYPADSPISAYTSGIFANVPKKFEKTSEILLNDPPEYDLDQVNPLNVENASF